MVRTYIGNSRALIIAAISCKDEMENQAIFTLAKEADPHGERTIGVLTKPDTIEPGCHDTWFQVLNNRRYKLKLGYFIIKNPSKVELDEKISFKQAREREASFFLHNSPWNVSNAATRDRMGVGKLSETLSLRLTELIEVSLPGMRAKVRELLDAVQKELEALPPPLSENSKIELLNRIHSYSDNIKQILEARAENKEVYQKIDNHFRNFNCEIAKKHPRLIIPDPENSSNYDGSMDDEMDDVPYIVYDTESNLEYGFTCAQIAEILERQKGRE
ncbi:hypothetical protein DSO57_1035220 [Entomophthora muscae]|uniref:Uncharacterized protein n=1 Tax=Entomophthora muscae TaxID=34485 RepID=A0ACC2TMG4_9FUNG|nr:hypothetical protein DSO57_1035220 [Entomophthora muscae]